MAVAYQSHHHNHAHDSCPYYCYYDCSPSSLEFSKCFFLHVERYCWLRWTSFGCAWRDGFAQSDRSPYQSTATRRWMALDELPEGKVDIRPPHESIKKYPGIWAMGDGVNDFHGTYGNSLCFFWFLSRVEGLLLYVRMILFSGVALEKWWSGQCKFCLIFGSDK